MTRQTVDLTAYLSQIGALGHPADFPVTLKPVFVRTNGLFTPLPNRLAVVREDTNETLAVVSNRYTLVPHERILNLVRTATEHLDVGPVPRGIYVDRQGARMRALFKFPSLAQPVLREDDLCPCLKVQNTYDGTSRIAVHIGAFRFVCTNLAVGGGGAFAGGFMSIHAGEIPIEKIARQLSSYLAGFEAIVRLYRYWAHRLLDSAALETLLEPLPARLAKSIRQEVAQSPSPTVYDTYNIATRYATHRMRSYRAAFDLLERINRTFQERFPLARG